MKTTASQYLRLGIFVISGLVILILAIFFIGNKQHLFGDTLTISSVFKNVNGLQQGNNVRFAGVNVGTVKQITIVNDTSIAVDMILDVKQAKIIKKTAVATINSDGLVGSMIINIIPRNKRNSSSSPEPVKDGDTIKTISQIATADMLSTLNQTNENAAILSANLVEITNSLKNGEGIAGALLKDETMAAELKETLANLQQTSASAKHSINRLNSILSKINLDESFAGTLLNDTVSAQKFITSLENLDSSTVQINQATRNFREFSSEVKTGKGVINFMLTDTSFVNHLDGSLQNIEEASSKFNENMEALKHNILFRGYFRKLERQQRREEARKEQE